MSNRTSSVKRRFVPASALVEALANDITRIKAEDGLKWTDIGAVLHRGDDMAAKYADGSATMDFVSFLRGKDQWNGRFSGSVENLLMGAAETVDPKNAQSCLLQAALALSVALEDGELTDAEIMANRKPLEDAADRIAKLLQRVKPRSVG